MTNSANTTFSQVNQFFIDFLAKMNVDSDIIQAWETEHQENLNELFNKLENEKNEKPKKNKKPRDAPKNAKSAYIFFSTENRPLLKEQNPELTSKEITVKLGELWKGIKDTPEAEKYNQLSLADKNRYEEEMVNYVPSDTESVSSENEKKEKNEKNEKNKKQRAKKAKDAPKSVRSAYMYFCQATRGSVKEEFPTLASKDITVKLGELWQQVKDTEEAKNFHELSTTDKLRYKEEMANYVPGETDTESVGSGSSQNSGSSKNKKIRAKKPKDAPKNVRSAYMYFCQETRGSVKEQFPTLASKDITVKLGEMWQQIKDTEEAKKFHELSTADKLRYKEEMENYVPSDSESDSESITSAGQLNNSNKKKTNKPRTKKPKDAPVSARSAYIFFCQEMRSQVKEEFPDVNVTAKLGEMWKVIKNTEDAKKYIELSNQDKLRYKEELVKYNSKVSEESSSSVSASEEENEEDENEDEPLDLKKKKKTVN